jgi:membrane-associated protease RseP (regulator of RpoE activity)
MSERSSGPFPDDGLPHDGLENQLRAASMGNSSAGHRVEDMTATERQRRRLLIPVLLFVTTCVSTYLTGGLAFCLALMATLMAHEMGHFLQAIRYRVPASLPYFIPMPLSPIGTMGAVIAMRGRMGDRISLFDIGISGPLAGLVPTLIFCVIGLQYSEIRPVPEDGNTLMLGEPLIFKFLAHYTFGPLPEGMDIFLHPIAYAGWVGLLITALNLVPIGQLDGGHVLYALLRRKARVVSLAFFAAAIVAVVLGQYWGWTLMLILLMLFGPTHPPTANDNMELGWFRTVLGYLTLGFVFIGFTPTPFVI